MKEVLNKIKKANLKGRGGAGFLTWKKWSMVNTVNADRKFVVCNGSEGEPGVKKDEYLLENSPERVVDGVRTAIRYLSFGNKKNKVDVKGYIYLNSGFYRKYAQKIRQIIHTDDIEVFGKPKRAGYIGGEETSLLNTIEGVRIEPRLKPPYPNKSGLWTQPTLVNNVETFYDISLIMHNDYKKERLYTIGGDVLHKGVYGFSEDMSIEDILIKTDNHPLTNEHNRSEYDFFVQVGGDGSGEVLNSEQINRRAGGAGSITVYSIHKHHPLDLMKYWINFFTTESCGQCVPCREGTYRLNNFLKDEDVNWKMFFEVLNTVKETSFCALGGSVHIPIVSYVENILKKYTSQELGLNDSAHKNICESFMESTK